MSEQLLAWLRYLNQSWWALSSRQRVDVVLDLLAYLETHPCVDMRVKRKYRSR